MKKSQKKETQPEIALPAEVCEACGFGGGDTLGLHAGPGALVVLKGGMTVMEVADAIDTLSKLASDLTVALAGAAGLCNGCGDLDGRSPAQCVADCGLCADILCGGDIAVPASLLEEAGIPKGAKLEASADEESGEIIVTESERQLDVTDLPAGVLSVLAASGVCLAELDERILLEDIVYGE